MEKKHLNKKNLRQQVVDFLVANPNSKPKDVAVAIGKKPPHVSVILSDLKKRGIVKNVEFGKYSFNENYDKKSSLHHGKKQKNKKSLSNSDDLDFDETLLELKEKYGKKEFVKKLKNIIKLLD